MKNPDSFTTRQSKWLKFLCWPRNSSRNNTLLRDYFFKQCVGSPQAFYRFVQSLEVRLKKEKFVKRKKELASKYIEILSLICERFGFFEEKNALDDLCFHISDPKNYKAVKALQEPYKIKSKKWITQILNIFKEVLREAGTTITLKGRYKNFLSIYKKLKKKHEASALSLNDIFAFCIVLKNGSIEECFEIASLLQDRFCPIISSFKDYVTIPKINGYQSIHIGLNGVIPELDLPIEIQIRTEAMDEYAEKGLAAHWFYATDKKSKLISQREKQLLTHFASISSEEKLREIYFFSYKKDVFRLERGATVLDFAYHLHSDLGTAVQSVLVNGKPSSLSTCIREGDVIRIFAAKEKQIRPEWLTFTGTKYAHKKIQEALHRSSLQKTH